MEKKHLFILVFLTILLGCFGGGGGGDKNGETVEEKNIWQPKPGTTWQWQLTGEIDTSIEAEMFDIDLFDVTKEVIEELHRKGKIVICYFSAGTYEPWRPDANQFPQEIIGNTLSEWPDEKWLNIKQLDVLAPIIRARLDLAVEKGCDGVEPDNVDAYTFDNDDDPHNDTGFNLTYEDQLRYNLWLAEEAHKRGLSIGLKNDMDQIQDLEPYFDWALNEECFYYNECEKLLPFVRQGKAVFVTEYVDSEENVDKDWVKSLCEQAEKFGFSLIIKTKDLNAWRIACGE